MDVFENAFVILHIRISHLKFLGIAGRLWFTLLLAFLVAFGGIQLVGSVVHGLNYFDFIGSIVYLFFINMGIFFWIKTWTLADKMLSKASDYERNVGKED